MPGRRGNQAFLVWLLLLALPGCLAAAARQPAEACSPEEIYQNAVPGVMTLEVETRSGQKCIGTGFLALGDGVAVTAWHLVQDARRVVARFADHHTVEITGVLDWDEVKDIAMLPITAAGRRPMPLCQTEPRAGARAYVIGAPKG
jgi:S1-C subfamily serine protease